MATVAGARRPPAAGPRGASPRQPRPGSNGGVGAARGAHRARAVGGLHRVPNAIPRRTAIPEQPKSTRGLDDAPADGVAIEPARAEPTPAGDGGQRRAPAKRGRAARAAGTVTRRRSRSKRPTQNGGDGLPTDRRRVGTVEGGAGAKIELEELTADESRLLGDLFAIIEEHASGAAVAIDR